MTRRHIPDGDCADHWTTTRSYSARRRLSPLAERHRGFDRSLSHTKPLDYIGHQTA
jgi:hypothetical protein